MLIFHENHEFWRLSHSLSFFFALVYFLPMRMIIFSEIWKIFWKSSPLHQPFFRIYSYYSVFFCLFSSDKDRFSSRHDSLSLGCKLKWPPISHVIDEKMPTVLRVNFYKGISRRTPTLSIGTQIGRILPFFKCSQGKKKEYLLFIFKGTLEILC